MSTSVPHHYITPIDYSTFYDIAAAFGIDVTHALDPTYTEVPSHEMGHDFVSVHPTNHAKFLFKCGAYCAKTVQFTRSAASVTTRFFSNRNTKAAALMAHWVTWSFAVAVVLSLITHAGYFLLFMALYVYVSLALFQAVEYLR